MSARSSSRSFNACSWVSRCSIAFAHGITATTIPTIITNPLATMRRGEVPHPGMLTLCTYNAHPTKISAMPPNIDNSCVPRGLRFIHASAMPPNPTSSGNTIWTSAPVLVSNSPVAINAKPANATTAGFGARWMASDNDSGAAADSSS